MTQKSSRVSVSSLASLLSVVVVVMLLRWVARFRWQVMGSWLLLERDWLGWLLSGDSGVTEGEGGGFTVSSHLILAIVAASWSLLWWCVTRAGETGKAQVGREGNMLVEGRWMG